MRTGTVWAQWAIKRSLKPWFASLRESAVSNRKLNRNLDLAKILRSKVIGSDGWNRTIDLGVMNPTL